MRVPFVNKEYEQRKQKAKELIAAGGCAAIKFWSNTDAERLCPTEHKEIINYQPEGMVYVSEWLETAKKAIELINRGISILENKQ